MNTDMTENEYQEAVEELKHYVEEHRDMEITDETSDCYRETFNLGKNRVIWGQYLREDTVADYSVNDVACYSVYDKELMFFHYNLDPIVPLCYDANYGLSVHRYDRDGLLVLTVDFTPDELKTLCEESEHRTSDESWNRFMENLDQDCIVRIEGTDIWVMDSEVEDNMAIVNFLNYIGDKESNPYTLDELKAIALKHFEDPSDNCFLTLAVLNKMDICFRFITNIDNEKHEDIIITPEEYSEFWS